MSPSPVERRTAYETLIRFTGLQIDRVDELPDGSCVMSLRPIGRRSRRWVHIGAGDVGLFAVELIEGCQLLRQVAAAKFAELPRVVR